MQVNGLSCGTTWGREFIVHQAGDGVFQTDEAVLRDELLHLIILWIVSDFILEAATALLPPGYGLHTQNPDRPGRPLREFYQAGLSNVKLAQSEARRRVGLRPCDVSHENTLDDDVGGFLNVVRVVVDEIIFFAVPGPCRLPQL